MLFRPEDAKQTREEGFPAFQVFGPLGVQAGMHHRHCEEGHWDPETGLQAGSHRDNCRRSRVFVDGVEVGTLNAPGNLDAASFFPTAAFWAL